MHALGVQEKLSITIERFCMPGCSFRTPSVIAQDRKETKLFIYIQSEKLKKQVKRPKPGILKEKVIRIKRIRVNFVVAILSQPSDRYYLVETDQEPKHSL